MSIWLPHLMKEMRAQCNGNIKQSHMGTIQPLHLPNHIKRSLEHINMTSVTSTSNESRSQNNLDIKPSLVTFQLLHVGKSCQHNSTSTPNEWNVSTMQRQHNLSHTGTIQPPHLPTHIKRSLEHNPTLIAKDDCGYYVQHDYAEGVQEDDVGGVEVLEH
jgi:hypothetical protein